MVISEVSDQQLVVFRERKGRRCLPFLIGIFEATVVDRTLKEMQSPRPLTHDAWLDTISALGARVIAACVHDRHDQTYFAELLMGRGQDLLRVDMRPSDALVVALKASVPFYFTEKLLVENAVFEEDGTGRFD